MPGRPLLCVCLVWLGVAGTVFAAEPTPDDLQYFESKVRPILVERCYSCHSAGAKRVRGGLLLDSKPGWARGGDTGPALVPGKPDESLLVEAIRFEDGDLKMPPKGKLPDEEIKILTAWVSQGAPDPRIEAPKPASARIIDVAAARQGWAYRPLAAPAPPKVRDASWCRTPIDAFILARLEAKGIAPNPPASRRQLIRRASFDLTGLPPNPDEVDAFLEDDAPGAEERLIERLLASPRYGERWARHWLDLARFAESHGFEHDYDRPSAYHYRDFVVEALNRDMPYDTFVKWQIAGDEFAPEDNLALKATGFLAAGVHSTQITANQVEKERYDELDDIVSTIGTSMLGLTIGCARCHDHKYDPIPQQDYYRLVATFTTTVRTEFDLKLDPEGDRLVREQYEKSHAPYVAALARFEAEELPGRLARWEDERSTTEERPAWVVLDLSKAKSKGGATFKPMPDGSILATGKNPDFDTYTIETTADLSGMTALRVEALADATLVKSGPGRAPNGNFDLTDLRVTAAPRDGSKPPITVVFKKETKATFEQKGLPSKAAIDDDRKSGWAIDPQFGKDHAAVFETEQDLQFEGGAALTFTLDFQGNSKHTIGRLRLSATSAARPVGLEGAAMPDAVARILKMPRDARTAEQSKALLTWYRTTDPAWQKRNRVVEEHAKTAPKPKTVKALISSEGLPAVRLHTQGGDFLEKTHFLKRGDPNQKQGEATQGFLQVLTTASEGERHWPAIPPEGWRTSYRRTALANWITDVDEGAGHLLARVIVNRLWQHHFGRGLVATPSDFGAQGDPPSHPELLDWLASELIRDGWRLKPLHALIMSSAVYQESVEDDPAKAKLDHDDTLVWRQTRRRLEAESIRDAMIAVSGLLDARMEGPGTLDEAMRRRSVYFTVKRSRLIPMMLLFDAPDALQGQGTRPTTTIAPQSLMLMNSPIVRAWAAGFARRVLPKASEELDSAVNAAYQIALSRPPSPAEASQAVAFLNAQRASYGPDGLEPALADFCQVLLGLNEFLYTE